MTAPNFWNEMVSAKTGETLTEMAEKQPVMLVFLRFFGCSFCREAISDIAARRAKFETHGFRVVFVHMAPDAAVAEKFFKKYKLFPVDHIQDPEKRFYKAFGLGRGTPQQLFWVDELDSGLPGKRHRRPWQRPKPQQPRARRRLSNARCICAAQGRNYSLVYP